MSSTGIPFEHFRLSGEKNYQKTYWGSKRTLNSWEYSTHTASHNGFQGDGVNESSLSRESGKKSWKDRGVVKDELRCSGHSEKLARGHGVRKKFIWMPGFGGRCGEWL